VIVQRLFSTFARGWPGVGLLLQRVIAVAFLFYYTVGQISHTTHVPSLGLQMTAAASGLFLLLGLWTPIAGMALAVAELALLISHWSDPRLCIVLAALGASLAMIGPGAWSLDARLFGRKEIRI
jgi:putative oxidoreductase